jgi:hypothetical protein
VVSLFRRQLGRDNVEPVYLAFVIGHWVASWVKGGYLVGTAWGRIILMRGRAVTQRGRNQTSLNDFSCRYFILFRVGLLA